MMTAAERRNEAFRQKYKAYFKLEGRIFDEKRLVGYMIRYVNNKSGQSTVDFMTKEKVYAYAHGGMIINAKSSGDRIIGVGIQLKDLPAYKKSDISELKRLAV